MSSIRRAGVVAGALLLGTLTTAARGLRAVAHRQTIEVASELGSPLQQPQPTLTQRPMLAVKDGAGAPCIVTVEGRNFAPGLTLTVRNEFYVFTFGAPSLAGLTPTSFRFDAASLVDGSYSLFVANASGLSSNGVPLAVRGK